MSKEVLVRGLRKGYRKGSQAVDGAGLDIETGEILVLRGPNGAGETTTVEILAGQRRRDAVTRPLRERSGQPRWTPPAASCILRSATDVLRTGYSL